MKVFKKILIGAASLFTLCVIVLFVHIYMVTRPKAPDATTRIMARVDIKQDISKTEADNITNWFAHEKGIDNVVCNAANHNIVFTYFPVKNTATQIVNDFKSSFSINAQRYVPTEAEMMAGCPVATTSKTYKVYNFFKKMF